MGEICKEAEGETSGHKENQHSMQTSGTFQLLVKYYDIQVLNELYNSHTIHVSSFTVLPDEKEI